LRKAIRNLLGDSINLIDTSDAVVRQLKRQLDSLAEEKISSPSSNPKSSVTFISSKDDVALLKMAQDLMISNLNEHLIHSSILSEMK
jgi:glutamate racemase